MTVFSSLYMLTLLFGPQTAPKSVSQEPIHQAGPTQESQATPASSAQTVNQGVMPNQEPTRQASTTAMITMTAPDSALSSASYMIGPQDSLQVNVWREPGLSGTFPVRPDGMISLSLIGEVSAVGKTPRKLGDEIALRLTKYITDPSVNVVVLSVYPKQVYLLGEVAHVGVLAITPEMTPLQAISAAGGVTPFAKTKNIYILRGIKGKQQKIPYNYKKAIKDGNEQGVFLVPGDTIVIP